MRPFWDHFSFSSFLCATPQSPSPTPKSHSAFYIWPVPPSFCLSNLHIKEFGFFHHDSPRRSSAAQRLDKIMATLHSRLVSDVDVQDYHFLVDPIDHHHITYDGFPQRGHLDEAFLGSNINIHFNPITSEMSVSTLGYALQVELLHLLLGKLRGVIAAHPQIADTKVFPFLWERDTFAAEVPHPLISLYRSARDVTPSIVINTSTFAGKRGKKGGVNTSSKSASAHVMTRYPGLQTMVRLDLGGLTVGGYVDREHLEHLKRRV
ncbi:hypothetical protein B0T26DRAFT_728881 [Lasiosphaeria miniovina]|uniref:Uncharacterized protein n=1 Tax=Lasiosphaeria miniovina TaxID=1954250 RepID=A0AA40A0J6_9PEZI|nr:uncharacterized protein B0T26DRAFT_728881 [Lasiosphaeria miniovina]KAK0707024.1 hypothetical protein B0T26DRAFT_728881 [Lasiosphaeria miniovina]